MAVQIFLSIFCKAVLPQFFLAQKKNRTLHPIFFKTLLKKIYIYKNYSAIVLEKKPNII